MSDTPRTDAHYKQIYDEGLGLEYCETELRYWAEKLEGELAEAKAQLPAEMQECNIVFKQCKLGHGWLTATNWVQHECQICELAEAVEKERERCARVCDEIADDDSMYLLDDERQVAHSCADAIRRGE